LKSILQLFLAILLVAALPYAAEAKGYSSGGRSYSSHSSSSSRGSSFSSSRGKTYGSGSSSGKSFTFGGGAKSYSAGGGHDRGYSAGKSYSSSMSFDNAAARAMKETASKRDFTQYKQSRAAKSPDSDSSGGSRSSYSGPVPPVIPQSRSYTPTPSAASPGWGGSYGGSYRGTIWYPTPEIYATRSIRIHNYYAPYWSRPVVVYNDNYSSLFWWWLLDQSLEDRALWVYHHRYDMDDARYRALVYQDMELENRVQQLEQRQVPVDPNYVPARMDRDLMYTDQYVNRAYATRPTHTGRIIFWFIMVPTAISFGGFFIWLVFFKRWQFATA
jgi:hypothetical protein